MPQPDTLSQTACAHCSFNALCRFSLSAEEMLHLEPLVSHQKTLKKGDFLYRAGSAFQSIYAIRAGFFKTDILLEDGRTQVTGFQMEGDILGLDGIAANLHSCNAVALENSEVCIIPYSGIERISQKIYSLQHQLNQVMSREIVEDRHTMLLLGTMRAEERLAAFLVNLSKRFSERGFSSCEFHLKMTREEIGSFLGLKLETVSRAFSRFQEEGWICVQNKHIKINNLKKLESIVQA